MHADLSPARGRPREFDPDEVLDKAIAVFSERGLHGTSIADLSAATGLTSGSLYKAFQDKRGLYLAALQHYKSGSDAALERAVQGQPDGRSRVRAALTRYAEASTGQEGLRGCMVVNSASDIGCLDEEMAAWIASTVARSEARLAGWVRDGIADGSISAQADPAATARALLCMVHGLRVVGKTRRRRAEMLAVVDVAMKLLG